MCKPLLSSILLLYVGFSVAAVTLGWIFSALEWYSRFSGSVGGPLNTLTWESRTVEDLASRFSSSSELLLSKAFSNTLKPSKIIPYYYRALHEHEWDDITITTIITSNRFNAFARLVEQYQGPISATIHISSTPDSHQTALIKNLHAIYTSSPLFPRWVDVHIVIDMHDRQFNMWRNLARLYARTAWVMMLDVDFVVCTDVRGRLRRALLNEYGEDGESEIGALARSGRAAFVIPAFEYVVQEEGKDWKTFPKAKKVIVHRTS
ncbi:hypothetical protein FRC12_015895 [Ceratobasidium sp. 428]|nr:hypothetical protein FRC12_015895 [Ceratobasidium sp. 428]